MPDVPNHGRSRLRRCGVSHGDASRPTVSNIPTPRPRFYQLRVRVFLLLGSPHGRPVHPDDRCIPPPPETAPIEATNRGPKPQTWSIFIWRSRGGVQFERLSPPTDKQAGKQTNKQSKYELICRCGWLDLPSSLDSETSKKLTKTVRSNILPAMRRPLLGYPTTAVRPVNQDRVKKKYIP